MTVDPTSVLFVCTGNICRSPLAEGVFLHKARARGVLERFRVDSAGTGNWHAGERPDPRVLDVARRHGVELPGRARQVHDGDLRIFDLLVAMDESHREHLLDRGAAASRVELLLSFAPDASRLEVPDPYYGGPEGFQTVYRLVDQGCSALLEHLLAVPR